LCAAMMPVGTVNDDSPASDIAVPRYATLSTAAATVLDRILGNHGHEITLTNATLGVTLNYTSFREICDDVDDARVYGGIHFRFDQDAGGRHGKDIGHFMLDNYLLPIEAEVDGGAE